ncbi:F-box/WD-40 repeat-containing protein [Drosera capensis]
MAFECQEYIGDCLSKYPLNQVQTNSDTLVDQVSCLKIEGESLELESVSKRVAAKGEEESEGGRSKGFAVETGSELFMNDGVLPSCRLITDLPAAMMNEIMNCLDPKELGILSCVSTGMYKIASDHNGWKNFYIERWGVPILKPVSASVCGEKTWKELFVEREYRSRTFLGHYRRDVLSGHSEAVRAVFLLASAKLIFTAGYDSFVIMWDVENGSFLSSSRRLGCTVRSVVADTRLLVAGGTDGFIQCWRAVEGLPCLFDLTGSKFPDSMFRLWGHGGPVSCLALDMTRVYSSSWDTTVRVWDRASFKCIVVLRHSDWVWSIAPHGSSLVSSAGSDVYVWDTSDATLSAFIPHAHVGNTCALARSHTGEFLFTSGEDGAIHMFQISDLVDNVVDKVATWIPHSGSVQSLAFEFPWLVSASSDGRLSLIDVRKLVKNSRRFLVKHYSKRKQTDLATIEAPQRMLQCPAGSLYSVAIGADRIVCGGEESTARIWDFSHALEKEQQLRAQRIIRLENRMTQNKLKLEMGSKGSGGTDRCSVAAKKNPINGDRAWHTKRDEQLKAAQLALQLGFISCLLFAALQGGSCVLKLLCLSGAQRLQVPVLSTETEVLSFNVKFGCLHSHSALKSP